MRALYTLLTALGLLSGSYAFAMDVEPKANAMRQAYGVVCDTPDLIARFVNQKADFGDTDMATVLSISQDFQRKTGRSSACVLTEYVYVSKHDDEIIVVNTSRGEVVTLKVMLVAYRSGNDWTKWSAPCYVLPRDKSLIGTRNI